MAINFPTSPSLNDTHTTSGGITYKWDGTSWKAQGTTSAYNLPNASATILGGIKVGNNLSINGSGVLSADASAITVQEEGVDLATAATTLNFEGTSVTASGTGATKTITIAAGGTPGGSANYIQYNDGSGGFGGDAKLRINTGNIVQTLEFWDASATAVSSAAVGCYYESLAGNIPEKNELLFYGARTTNSSPALSIGTDYAHLRFKLKDASNSLGTTGQVLTVDSNGWVKWDAGGGGTTGLSTRSTASGTTASVAAGASVNLDITGVAKSYGLLKIGTSAAAWVTLYTSSANRLSDVNRAITTDPVPGSGVVAEVITSGDGTQIISPMLCGYNDESTPITTVYAKVRNETATAQAITVTLTFVQLEA